MNIDYIQKGEKVYPLEIPYGTGEIRVGTWIDGKPLYKKTISCGALPNNNSSYIDTGITDFDKIVNIYGYSYNPSSGITLPVPYSNPNPISVYGSVQNNKIMLTIQTTINRSAFTETYLSIEYTKTTD